MALAKNVKKVEVEEPIVEMESIEETESPSGVSAEEVEPLASSGYSVDVIDFNDNAFVHVAVTNTLELAIALADERELLAEQMVRVSPVSYFRAKHD